jgi:predicted dehydrogenase
MDNSKDLAYSRRDFVKTAAVATAAIGFPTIVPSSVFGKNAPSNMINVGQIGCGRIATVHDLKTTLRFDDVRVIAIADFDGVRQDLGKKFVLDSYKAKTGKDNFVDVKLYDHYQELIANKDIDAVQISTPDHWHAQVAIEAALAGKHIYCQKPTSLTIEEGRTMSNMISKTGVVFQLGSQQRSVDPWPQFKRACELVRNGRIGELKTVRVGLPGDPGGGITTEMPLPERFNYDAWLGSTPYIYYTQDRVAEQRRITDSRPGWLRMEQFGAGMITGWGVHHIDIAHWGMNTEYTGPIAAECTEVVFPKSGLWNVHGDFEVHMKYATGVNMIINGKYENGIKFEGTKGWIFCTRDGGVTATDPKSNGGKLLSLRASDPKILESKIGANEVHLYDSPEQHRNWIDCIKNKKRNISPVEVAHRSCSACLVAHASMKFKTPLHFDPVKEHFIGNAEANKLLSRPQRYPYGTSYIKV